MTPKIDTNKSPSSQNQAHIPYTTTGYNTTNDENVSDDD